MSYRMEKYYRFSIADIKLLFICIALYFLILNAIK